MSKWTEHAPAKVNLSLHVGPVKANGRHDLTSLVTFSDSSVCDILTAEPASHFSLAVEGDFAEQAGSAKDNLVLKAARAINEALNGKAPPLAFRLNKRLPSAAGIGGGSADAGAALRLIARAMGETGAEPIDAIIRSVAPRLGGDVVACTIGQAGLMTGEGEKYEPMLGLPPLPALLVNPGLPCPTGPVFERFDETGAPQTPHPLPKAGRARKEAFCDYLAKDTTNSLQQSAMSLVPEIGDVLQHLAQIPGARLTRMSGSGASCFALFDSVESAERAAGTLMVLKPSWWVRASLLGGR